MEKVVAGNSDRHGYVRGVLLQHICGVIKRVIFIGFTVQIILGVVWMCCNFTQVQDFGWRNLGRTVPEGVIYGLYSFLGQVPLVLYLLQLAFGFFAGYQLLRRNVAECFPTDARRKAVFSLWGSLALLTFPFAMQCHLAILPYSVMSSLFLLMISFLLEAVSRRGAGGLRRKARQKEKGAEILDEKAVGQAGGSGVSAEGHGCLAEGSVGSEGMSVAVKRRPTASGKESNTMKDVQRRGKRRGIPAPVLAVFCGALAVLLAWEAGTDERDAIWGRGPEAVMASRLAWPSVWNDREYWPEELLALVEEEELWRAAYCPGNMEIVLEAIKERAGEEAAKGFYKQMAETAWQNRSSVIIRQVGWDMIGYGAAPLVFRQQMEGRAYDSYTGRNYEAMRGHSPVLTRYYVEYGCWWYGCSLVFALFLSVVRLLRDGVDWRRLAVCGGVCVLAGALPVLLYTVRGAGLMDYRCTIGSQELWPVWALLCIGIRSGGERRQGMEKTADENR